MHRLKPFCIVVLFLAVALSPASATMVEPVSTAQQVTRAAAICRATVVGQESFVAADGGIQTRTALRVDEVMKGTFPAVVAVVHRGGFVGTRCETFSTNPKLRMGEERLLFLGRRADGTLYAEGGAAGARRLQRTTTGARVATSVPGGFAAADAAALTEVRALVQGSAGVGADVTSQAIAPQAIQPQAVPGLLVDSLGFSARFLAPDRGEPIEYLVDAQALPTGITQAQALNAVSNAFKAWSNVTSLKFKFAGVTNFGKAASTIRASDGRIRIQLHDLYNDLAGASELGQGGNLFFVNQQFPKEGTGGRVGTNEFYEVSSGYLAMKHTQIPLQTLSTLEEVLTHEIGHTLSLDHSSENQAEPNFTLRDAIMFPFAHLDGRGARLGTWDPPVVRQAYPQQNTPPFGFNRVMDIVTAFPGEAPNLPGINRIELRGYDLQSTNLTVQLTNATATGAGVFSLTNTTLYFTPAGAFTGARIDPATGDYYESVFVRLSDGTNASPYYTVNVISLQPQLDPARTNGLPDAWVAQFFGSASATVNANADADGDGISNINEFRLGTNPTNAVSALRIASGGGTNVHWLARPYDLYEVQATTNFTTWSRLGSPVLPTTTNGSLSLPTPAGDRRFLRVLRVP